MAQQPPKLELLTAINYARYLQKNGVEAHSLIRVQNLSTEALVGGAIWGVSDADGHCNVLQPVLVSSAVSLREPFRSAAQNDSVNNSTVNYSTLSKKLLKVIASRRPDLPHSEDFQGLEWDWSLYELMEWIQIWLTGYSPPGDRPTTKSVSKYLDITCRCLLEKDDPAYKPPFLDVNSLLELSFTLFLPKATLLSSGVSLSTSSTYWATGAYQSVLKIHGIRVPTLIGVNAKERPARQPVIVSVEIDPYICRGRDYYNELEQIIVKTTEESSFETLESLAVHLNRRIIKYFVYGITLFARNYSSWSPSTSYSEIYSNVRICLEKPSAVTFADAPSIEIIRSSNPVEDRDARELLTEFYERSSGRNWPPAPIPYPLQGALSRWISENWPGDST